MVFIMVHIPRYVNNGPTEKLGGKKESIERNFSRRFEIEIHANIYVEASHSLIETKPT